jgi:hypothetical protein
VRVIRGVLAVAWILTALVGRFMGREEELVDRVWPHMVQEAVMVGHWRGVPTCSSRSRISHGLETTLSMAHNSKSVYTYLVVPLCRGVDRQAGYNSQCQDNGGELIGTQGLCHENM